MNKNRFLELDSYISNPGSKFIPGKKVRFSHPAFSKETKCSQVSTNPIDSEEFILDVLEFFFDERLPLEQLNNSLRNVAAMAVWKASEGSKAMDMVPRPPARKPSFLWLVSQTVQVAFRKAQNLCIYETVRKAVKLGLRSEYELAKISIEMHTSCVRTMVNNSFSISDQAMELIKKFERFMPKLYNDNGGNCSIGYGTLIHQGKCNSSPSEQPYINGISEQEATELLRNKMNQCQRIINESVMVALNQNQYDSLISFVQNIGEENFKKSTLLQQLNNSNYFSVSEELRKWIKVRIDGILRDSNELIKRRNAEADLFQRPVTVYSQSYIQYNRSFSAVDYMIPGIISPLQQPSVMVCWATVATMMISWKKNQSISIESAIGSVGNTFLEKFQRDEGLSADEKTSFLRDTGLSFEYPQNLTIEGWEKLLREYGPVWVTTDEDPSINFAIHARIISAIKGDGTPQGTFLTITDPGQGNQYSEKFSDFLVKYEQEVRDMGAAWSGRIQIVHWPSDART